MSVTLAARRGMLRAAVAGLSVTAVCLTAGSLPAEASPASLHVTGRVQIAAGTVFAGPVTQAPDGTVYFGRGRGVFVVHGTAAPRRVRTMTGRVVGLGASSAWLLVEVDRTVTAYRRATGRTGRHWHLPSRAAVHEAGLFPVGSTVWAWTDPATETGGQGTGAQPATVSRFRLGSARVHKVTGDAAQGMLAADAAGAYFLDFGGSRLVHVTPAGHWHSVRYSQYPAGLTLAGGRVQILADHFIRRKSTLRVYLDAFSARTLRKSFSRQLPLGVFALAGTGAGLLALNCPTASCATERVEQLSPASGRVLSSLRLPFATRLVPGRSGVAITQQPAAGSRYRFVLNRLAG